MRILELCCEPLTVEISRCSKKTETTCVAFASMVTQTGRNKKRH